MERQTGESDNLLCALQLVTHLMKGKKQRVVAQRLAESSKDIISEALKRFTAVDNARTLVAVGELSKFGEVRQTVLSNFHPHACVKKGEDVLALRRRRNS